ncbi:protein phosphatase 2C domain-containing protein [uncultured Megasphaera sp.]|uniref:protein phosphatase 2C domain-containing protein n=1 Tax=Megasphaera massiliensis TaxID=1232428 RepID=UPI00266C6922|nr:protein phosphatase 2C domain-containing protein [uncultured Megasphaera sp.]
MISGGISIMGSYHEINQDSFISKPYKDGYILVVSDGMGSKSLSHLGSRCICESTYDVIRNFAFDLSVISFKDVIYACHEEWKRRLADYDIKQCYATLLVAVIWEHQIRAARLGDGFLTIYADGNVSCLYDKKETYFANETDCLSEILDREKIETVELAYSDFQGIVSCTDGIEIGTMQEADLVSFTRDLVADYANKSEEEITADLAKWVVDWPGIDDKTLAFVIEGAK